MTAPLDIEQPDALIGYLRENGYIAADEQPSIQVLTGGVSNRTVLVKRPSGEAWVVKQALDKLRVAVDWFCDPARIHAEAAGLRWLRTLTANGSVPKPIFEDHNDHLLAMQAVPQPHENWKVMLLRGDIDLHHAEQFGHLLGTIHREAYLRRDEIQPQFADIAIFDDLRTEAYYQYTGARIAAAESFYAQLVTAMHANRLTLVHGDYSPKNILVHQDRLILLDHECIHWGDPGFDIGFSLTHLLSKAHHVVAKRSAFVRAAATHWHSYRLALGAVAWGDELEPRAACHLLGCLLARIDGRSPLEYLTDDERERQRAAVLSLLDTPPTTIPALIDQFISALA